MPALLRFFQQRPLVGWLGLCLLVKAALVLALADVFFYGEELEKGTAAKAMLDSLAVPHHQLAYHYYEGGGFLISHLKALAFLVAGENLLAHKLVALGFALAVLAAGWHFTLRMFSRSAAHWFCALLIFAPECFQKLSLLNLGIHFEACLFLFGVLGLGAQLIAGEPGRRPWFLLGLVTGFGLYFSYQIGLAAVWVLAGLLWRRPREVFGVGGVLGLLGTLLGALPLFVMYSLVGEAVFDIHGESIAGANLERLTAFAHSVFVEPGGLSSLTAGAWCVAVPLAVFVLAAPVAGASSRRPALFIAGYLVLFCMVYLGGGFIGGRVYHFFLLLRLAPVWIFGSVLVAAALAALQERPGAWARGAGQAGGALLLALGLCATLGALAYGSPGEPLKNWRILMETKGYSYDQYFAKVLWHFEGTRMQRLELCEAFNDSDRDWLRAAAVANLWSERAGAASLEEALDRALAEFADLAPERRRDSAFGLAPLLVAASDGDGARALAVAEKAPEGLRLQWLEALGRFGSGRHPYAENLSVELERSAAIAEPEAFRRAFRRGLGRWLYSRFRLSEESAEDFCAPYGEALTRDLLSGYRAERAWHTLPGD